MVIYKLRPPSFLGLRQPLFCTNCTGVLEKHKTLQFLLLILTWLYLFPIFFLNVNWIVFYVTLHVFKSYYQQILWKTWCHVLTKFEHEVIILWIWRTTVDEIGEVHKSSRSQMFFRSGVLISFAIFTEKHLRWSLFY